MIMMEDVVSIVVPVYNAEKYIKETIGMVERQTYKQWELILVDDCSTDNSAGIIEECRTRPYAGEEASICLIKKEKNEGAARARNTGSEYAKGRFLAFLDADDVWLPDKLEKEIRFLKEKGAAFVFTAYEFGDEAAGGTGKIVAVPEKLNYHQALSRTVIFTSTVMFDRQKMDHDLLLMPAVESEDTATWWKILRNGHTAYGLNEVTTIYRRPVRSLSSNKMTAINRIWKLYRQEEKLSLPYSIYNFVFWALRATLRRI